MLRTLKIGIFALFIAAATQPSDACTLWAVTGPGANGGTIISKNRDWKPDHTQLLKHVRTGRGFAFFGLYAEGNDEPGIKAGINEKGLTIVSASTNIPRKTLLNQPGKRGIMTMILEKYATIDDLLIDADRVFSSARAGFFLIADRRKALVAEVGLDGKYSLRQVENATTTHTNHYLAPELAALYNEKIGKSSATRLARINQLLAEASPPFSVAQFVDMSRDRHDGPDDSLWRTGKSMTLASWIVESPAHGAPRLHVTVANPNEKEVVHDYILDETFWGR